MVALTLPVAADPRFKIHYAAIERWSREAWANTYADGRDFQGTRRVPKDTLHPHEFVELW